MTAEPTVYYGTHGDDRRTHVERLKFVRYIDIQIIDPIEPDAPPEEIPDPIVEQAESAADA